MKLADIIDMRTGAATPAFSRGVGPERLRAMARREQQGAPDGVVFLGHDSVGRRSSDPYTLRMGDAKTLTGTTATQNDITMRVTPMGLRVSVHKNTEDGVDDGTAVYLEASQVRQLLRILVNACEEQEGT